MMTDGLYTIVCDFEGGTSVSQVHATDEREAVAQWAATLEAQRHLGDASDEMARIAAECGEPPIRVDGLSDVWCWTASVGTSLALLNIIRSAE